MPITINGGSIKAWVSRAQADIRLQRDSFFEEAREAAALSVMDGAVRLQDLLELATTPTGEKRVARGGVSAGRHNTGNLVGSISYSEEEQARVEEAIQWFDYGWFAGLFEQYFQDQDLELGNNGNGAQAMHGSFIYAREIYKARLSVIVARRR